MTANKSPVPGLSSDPDAMAAKLLTADTFQSEGLSFMRTQVRLEVRSEAREKIYVPYAVEARI